MMPRVFVDCDVILDLLLARQPYFPATTRLFMLFQERQLEGCVSPLVFSNLFYVLRKATSASQAVEALKKLRQLTRTLPVDDEIVGRALSSSFTDFEDGIQYFTALTHGLDALVTRNKRDYKAAELPVFNAEECVRWLRSQDA